MKKVLFVILSLLIVSFVGCNHSNRQVANIIFDTDMGPDYDDVGAMAVLHALADNGEANILATLSSNMYEQSVPCIDVLNHYFGRPDLPLGAPKKGVDIVDRRFVNENYWCDALPQTYPHKVKRASEAPDAVEVYRKVLSSQPDTSVTIVTVGFFTNLAALLETGSDKYSNLNGADLVKKKVKRLVSMAGSFPKGREFNVFADSTSSVKVFNEWPTPIILSGFQIGVEILTGLRLVAADEISHSPVKDAFALCIPTDKDGRCSWDQTAVLVGVRGYEGFFDIKYGRMNVLPNGNNTWTDDPNGPHGQLTRKMPKEELTHLIEDLMMHQPVR